jgi:hypothetical protein
MAEISGGTTASASAKTDLGSERVSPTEDEKQQSAASEAEPTSPPDGARSAPTYRKRRGRPSRARGQPNSSDAASARWTIRGVPPHIRDMALKSAEARGMTVGDWIAEAIVGFVRGSGKAAPAAEQKSNLPTAETPPDLVDMMTRLEARLTRLEERRTLGFFGRLFGKRR